MKFTARYLSPPNAPVVNVKQEASQEEKDKQEEDAKQEEEAKKQAKNLDLIIKQKIFRQSKYLELIKEFMDKHCEYEFLNMVPHHDLKHAYSEFLRENNYYEKNLNISLALTPSDIQKLDTRYSYKRVHLCGSCRKKQYSGCCGNYNIRNRRSVYYMVNIKLK
jgi:hypothetical protein